MGEAKRKKELMAKEAEKRWDAKILVMSAVENPKAGDKDQADLILKAQTVELKNVFTPGANQYGFMVFNEGDNLTMIPVQDVKRIDLKARKVQSISRLN